MGANNLSFSITARNNSSSALNSLKNQISSLKNGIASIGSGTKSFTSSLSNLRNQSSNTTRSVSTLGQTVQRVIGIFSGFKVVNTLFNTVTSSIDQAFERIDTIDMFLQKMALITGNAELATQALEELKTSTKGTPYALDIAAQGVQNFVLRGMETQQAVDSINIWMDAVSTYGKGTNEQFQSVTDAIAKMRSKGTVEMRYLNRLFAVGINPVKMYAEATGQAATDVQTALSKKEISSEEFLSVVEDAMRNGTNGVLKIAGNAKKFATTWAATMANMRIAIARGWAEIIDDLDDAFKVINPDKGLKGIVAGFGTTIEKVLDGVAVSIKNILPPILSVVKSAFNYWKSYYFDPLKKYFDSFVNPVRDSMKAIKEAFSVEGEVDINGLVQQLNYKGGTGNLKDALLEVIMSWENLKKTSRDTWNGLNKPVDTEQQATYKFNIDKSILAFLTTLDNTIGRIQSRIPQLLTAFKNLGDSLKNTFGSVIEIILTVAGGIAEFTLELGSIIVPPAMEALTNGFTFLSQILNELAQVIRRFAQEKLPQIIDSIVQSLNELSNTPFIKSLIKSFEDLGERVSSTFNTIKDYSAYLRNEKDFSFDPTNVDQGNIIRIFENLRKLFSGIVDSIKPIREALKNVFDTEVNENKVVDGFSRVLEIIADLSDIIADEVPKIVNTISKFVAKVIVLIRPVGEFLWNLATRYILPFAVSVIRAFVNLAVAVAPLVQALGKLILTIAGFIIPPALTLFTNICNWIADHADIVVAGIVGIVTGFLTLKTISTVTSVLGTLGTVLFDVVIPAVTTFFEVMTTQGIGAAIASIMNPVILIPTAIVALVGLAAGLIYLYTTSDTAREKINNFIASFLTMTTGIKVNSQDVSTAFTQIGDTLNWLKEQIDGLLKKIDEFFDKFDGFRTVLKAILKAPGMDYGGWLGSNEDVSTDTVFNPQRDLGLDKLPSMKIQMPNLMGNTEQWRATAQEATDVVKQSVEQNIPEVGASGTATINTLYSNMVDTLSTYGSVDTSTLTANIDQLPTEGYNAGQGLGLNLSAGIDGMGEAVNIATGNISGTALGTLNTNLAGDPTYQTGVSFIDTFNAGFTTQAQTSYMLMASFINNCLTILQAGFNNPESIIPTTIAQTLSSLMLIISQKVEMYCNEINQKLTACYTSFLNSVDVTFDEFVAKHENTVNAIFPAFQNTIKLQLDDTVQKYSDFSNSVHKILDDLNSYHYTIGVAMMNSLEQGIRDTMPKVISVEAELVQKLKTTFESGLGIASPSKQWFWYGQMLNLGLINGLSSNNDKVQKLIGTQIDNMNGAFKDGHFNADQTVNFLTEQGTLDLIGRVKKMDFGDATDTIAYPLAGTTGTISSYFGNRESPGGIGSTNHAGMDLATDTGTPILSALAGTVTTANWYGGYGNAVVVDSGNGLSIVYGHMSQIGTTIGKQVAKGEQIGLVGSTGNSTGPHLHFEMRQDGNPFDPLPYLGGAQVMAGNTLAAVLQNAYNKKYHPELLAGSINGNVAWDISGGAQQWAPLVLQALRMLGQPESYLQGILYAIDSESSGDPNAINLTDSNAAKGTPSRGLLQTIPDTFYSYALPGYNTNIVDPLSNILAGLNYMMHTGGIAKIINDRAGGWFGYAVGTRYVPQDMLAMIHEGEAILPASQNPYSNSGGDYLAELFSNAIGDTGINDLSFDLSALSSGSSSGNNINNNLNNVFNISNTSDVDADRNVSNMEQALHKLLQDAMRAGSSR